MKLFIAYVFVKDDYSPHGVGNIFVVGTGEHLTEQNIRDYEEHICKKTGNYKVSIINWKYCDNL